MAQPGQAPSSPREVTTTITVRQQGNNWVSDNPNVSIRQSDNIRFNCATQGGCRIYFSPSDAFDGQSSPLDLNQGNNGPYDPKGVETINYCVCGPSDTCTPVSPEATGGYVIEVGSGDDDR